MVCSAAETLLPPGVFMTTTPRRVAAGTSMLSTPTPARAIARSLPGILQTFGGDLRLRADDAGVELAKRGREFITLEAKPGFDVDPGGAKQFNPGSFQFVGNQQRAALQSNP